MDTKKLAKIIKIIVEQELKRQLPDLIKEGVTKVLNENKQLNNKQVVSKIIEEEIDPFKLANSVLDENRLFTNNSTDDEYIQPRRQSQQVRQFAKNPILNEILNNTQPFSKSERNPEQISVLDKFTPDALNENFNDMNKTISFDTNSAQGGMDVIKAQMAAKMGYGGYTNPNGGGKKEGLGVTTGLSGLDRILNRDNSELVKKFKTR
jgi:hypothetical protein